MIKKILAQAIIGATALYLANAATAAEITGAGASFPAPLYAKWADAYQRETGHKVNYQSIGSGGGVKQILAKTVDFGASDAPMKPADLEKNGLLQFPTVIGGVVPVINIKGIATGQLKLTGSVLADIFLGKISQWNDKAIQELNPTLNLPAAPIAVVRRADGSGTSFIFTNYLAKVSSEWQQKVGEGSAVQWPVGLGGKGNEGVSAFVQRLDNSIGYVEYVYAQQSRLATVVLANAAGQFVTANQESFTAAAANAQWDPSSYYQILTNQAGAKAWPIAGATFILMHKNADKPEQANQALSFFAWAFKKEGRRLANGLDYVPLPDTLTATIEKQTFTAVKSGNGNAVYAQR